MGMVIVFLFRECIGAMLTIILLDTPKVGTSSERIPHKDEECSTTHIEHELPYIRNTKVWDDQ